MTSTDNTPVPDYANGLRMDGRGIVLLGAGQGIGRQAAHALSACGARVLCVDLVPDLAKEVAAEVDGVPWVGDVTSRAEVERLRAEADGLIGGIDGVVDIIGMARYAELSELGDDLWNWHFDIVLRHAYLALQVLTPAMAARGGGAVAVVASVSGLSSAPLHAAYGAAKAGLMSLVRSAAVELGPKRIRVNAVAPGVVWTPRVSNLLGPEGEAVQIENTPLHRVALPADIASALLFLMSDLASFVTGQTLVVDGGVTSKFPFPMPFLDRPTDAG
ncbi:MAG: SDR family oxidoreductase [Frankia sp.]|nr:SDR family oxidoreductase [Frankia sp.]